MSTNFLRLSGLLLGLNLLGFSTAIGQTKSFIPMELYWNDLRHDGLSTATRVGKQEAVSTSYEFIRVEACIFPTKQANTIPLNFYVQSKGKDALTSTTAAAGYSLKRVEGYIYGKNETATIPLNLYWNDKRKDYLTVASTEGINRAKRSKYRFMKVIGYVHPAGYCR